MFFTGKCVEAGAYIHLMGGNVWDIGCSTVYTTHACLYLFPFQPSSHGHPPLLSVGWIWKGLNQLGVSATYIATPAASGTCHLPPRPRSRSRQPLVSPAGSRAGWIWNISGIVKKSLYDFVVTWISSISSSLFCKGSQLALTVVIHSERPRKYELAEP